MRILLVAAFLLTPMLSGCMFFGGGVESSSRDCPASEPSVRGVVVELETDRFDGYCFSVYQEDDVVVERKVEDGAVFLPLEERGHYWGSVQVAQSGDDDCVDEAMVSFEHPGRGVINATADVGVLCS